MKVNTITMWCLLEEIKKRIPDMQLCGGTDEENRYRGEAKRFRKTYGFGHIGTDENLFVFESPIDHIVLYHCSSEEWEKHSYISLGGLSEKQ